MENIIDYLSVSLEKHGYGNKAISKTDHLKNDLGLDSLGVLTMVDELEEKYDIFLDADDMAKAPETVGDIAELVQKKIESKK